MFSHAASERRRCAMRFVVKLISVISGWRRAIAIRSSSMGSSSGSPTTGVKVIGPPPNRTYPEIARSYESASNICFRRADLPYAQNRHLALHAFVVSILRNNGFRNNIRRSRRAWRPCCTPLSRQAHRVHRGRLIEEAKPLFSFGSRAWVTDPLVSPVCRSPSKLRNAWPLHNNLLISSSICSTRCRIV